MHSRVLCFSLLPLAIRAQITLSKIPGTACGGNPLGTATFSTQLTLETGSERIVAGDFWEQPGANWKFSTDTEGIIFSGLGIPGFGAGVTNSIPQQAEDALKIEDSKTAWDLSIPSGESLGSTWDIVFQAAPSSANGSTPESQATPAAAKLIRRAKGDGPLPTPPPNLEMRSGSENARVHARNWKRQDAGSFNLKIEATSVCLQTPTGSATASVTGSPALASLCDNNEISAGPEAWSTYGAQTYMSSLLSAAAPNPTAPQVFGASVIHDDVNPPGAYCTYTAKCDAVGCSSVKDHGSGNQVAIQRFLAYNSVVNLNNFLNSIYNALLDSGTISSLVNAKLVTTFFTNPTPDATWEQITGIFTPLLGALSAFLGPFSAAGSAAFGAASGLIGAAVAGGTIADLQPVVDKRFSEYADVNEFVGQYLKTTVKGIEHAYDVSIGQDSSAVLWGGSDLAPDGDPLKNGYFADGLWSKSDYTQGLSDNVLDNFVKIFAYKVINFAFIDSGVFIMYTPYGKPVKGTDGKMIDGGIDQNYCETKLKVTDNIGTLTVCDAPGGMARIINGEAKKSGNDFIKAVPQGWDSGYQILPDEKFNIADAVKGSVASFQAGDFGYDVSNPFNDAFKSDNGPSADQIKSIQGLEIKATTAGFFNVPVCQIFDLRFNPLTSGSSCSACGLARGVKDTGVKFLDKVNQKVKDALTGPPDCVQAYTSTICSKTCPEDAYYPS